MKQICVLAGDHRQYNEWLRENKYSALTKDVFFGDEREYILGRDISEIKIVGSFFDRRDSLELYRLALVRKKEQS